MKRLLLALSLAPVCALAQLPNDQPEPPKSPRDERPRDTPDVPPELRERFREAREKAMQDPKVRRLREEMEKSAAAFREAMRDAMLRADPGLADALKKWNDRPGKPGKWGKPGDNPPGGGGFGFLSEGDRERFLAAREKAKDDPAVIAARDKRDQAKTPEERMQAAKEFHEAMRAALLKVDPTLAPILDRIKPPGPPKKPEPADTAGPMATE